MEPERPGTVRRLVLDASVALAWCFEDERTDETDAILEAAGTMELIVPLIWQFELANGLLVAERRGRIEPEQVDELLSSLRELGVTVVPIDVTETWRTLVRLGRKTGLAVYDASYVQLALDERIPLATVDGPMRAAAQTEGIVTLP